MTRVLVLGATSAIAQAATRAWALRGAAFFLVARNPHRLEAVASDLRCRGAAQVEMAQADLDDGDQHAPLVERAFGALGGVDVALLAHGVLGDRAINDSDPTAAERVLRTNLVSPVRFLTVLAPRLLPGATIAALSSVAGDRGRAANAAYGASKAGLDAYLSALRQRLSSQGIQVVTVKPGFVDTPMTRTLRKNRLFASAGEVGRGLVRAVDHHRNVVYLPWFWRPIMLLIRAIPEALFKKLSF